MNEQPVGARIYIMMGQACMHAPETEMTERYGGHACMSERALLLAAG
jgi:hypothetical protein